MSDDALHPHDPPPLPEPQTPMWLPAVGVALFVSVALWWAVTPKAPPPPPQNGEMPAASASAPAQAVGSAGSVRMADGGIDPSAVQRLLDRLPK